MPGINDSPKQVEEILELCGEAGAVNIGGIPLHLRGEVRDIFFEWLRSYRPDLVPRYEQLYARGAYVGREERERIQALLRPRNGRPDSGTRAMRRTAPGQDAVTVPTPRPPRAPTQDSLF
jgi:DNA repair photolyase